MATGTNQKRRPPRSNLDGTPPHQQENHNHGSAPPPPNYAPYSAPHPNYQNNYQTHAPDPQHNPPQYWSPPYRHPPDEYRSLVGRPQRPKEQHNSERKRRWVSPDLDILSSKDCQIAALKAALSAQKFIDNHSEKDCKIQELKSRLKGKEKEIVELQRRNHKLKQELESRERELRKIRVPSNSSQMMRKRLEGIIAERNEKIKSLQAKCAKFATRMKRVQKIQLNPVCEWHRSSISPKDMEWLKAFDISAPLENPDDESPVYPPRALDKSVRDAIGKTPGGPDYRAVGGGRITSTPPEARTSRTRLCTFFALSKCYKDDCHFAHGLRELQPFNVKNYKSDDCMGVIGCLGLDCKYRHGETRTALKDGFYLVYGGNLDAPRLCYMPEGDEMVNAEEKFHSNLGKIIHRLERLLPRKLLPAQIIMVYRDY